MTATPRRTCPACTLNYGGLVNPNCPICRGLGTLTLGAAALHNHPAAPIARAIELHLETTAQHIRQQLPLTNHHAALAAATDELVHAGILATTHTGTPAHARTPTPETRAATDHHAHQLAATLGPTPTNDLLHAPTIPLTQTRPRPNCIPIASATGHPSATATIANPIDPLGPDTPQLELEYTRNEHTARVLAAATPHAAHTRSNRP